MKGTYSLYAALLLSSSLTVIKPQHVTTRTRKSISVKYKINIETAAVDLMYFTHNHIIYTCAQFLLLILKLTFYMAKIKYCSL